MTAQRLCPCCGAPDPASDPCECDWGSEEIDRCFRHQPSYEAALKEIARLRRVYAIFEEMAPPDLPRDMFARGCFAAWEGMDAKNHRIEQLEAALRQYAADANWMAVETGPFGATDDAWMGEDEGPTLARKILETQP